MTTGKRVFLGQGCKRRKLIITAPPFPKFGDTLQDKDGEWIVLHVETTDFQLIPRKEPPDYAR
jgi:hypothetical protein